MNKKLLNLINNQTLESTINTILSQHFNKDENYEGGLINFAFTVIFSLH